MTIPAISALPTAPSRNDPATFADRADAMVSALPTLVTQINATVAAIPAEIEALALDAAADATAPYTSAAAASAVSAAAARDLSIAAWAASMTPAETLPAISQSLHIGAIVAAKIYDTSKDSDGGAWRKRCQHTSWYSETLGGNRWIGQQASIAAAWTAAGSTTGAVFQASATAGPLTIGKYYAATSGTTATEVFRGVKAEFPAVAAIVAETGRVVIYDMTVPVPAMWMVFKDSSYTHLWLGGVTGVAFYNGILLTVGVNGLANINFIKEWDCWRVSSVRIRRATNCIADRNDTSIIGYTTSADLITFAAVANAVAVTVLPGAPVDPATGLPVPTIAVATAGGVSVLKSDGTVVNLTYTVASNNSSGFVAFTQYGGIVWSSRLSGSSHVYLQALTAIPSSSYSGAPDKFYGDAGQYAVASSPHLVGSGVGLTVAARAGGSVITGGVSGATVLKENPATPAKGMVAYLTAAYPGMWQVGDSRRAWLCDAAAETVTGAELVTNGVFATDAGWTKEAGWTISAGVASFSGASGMSIYQPNIITAGKMYVVTFTVSSISSGAFRAICGGQGQSENPFTTTGTYSVAIIATSSTHINIISSGSTVGSIDNISVRLAELDRSVKTKPISIYGSLTKTLVGGVATYSGFSASNYLEEAYSADLDFGTGDFCIIGWQLLPNFSMPVAALHRSMAESAGGVLVQTSTTSGEIVVYLTASSTFTAIGSPMQSTAGVWQMIAYVRRSGVLESYLDGQLSSSVSNSTNITYANAVTRVGARLDSPNAPGHSIAMWRLGATAPSADQIAQIYRDELALFQTGAVGTLAGSSSAVTALDYDDSTDLLHVGTSTHRSAFRGLTRVSSEATPAGAITSLSASGGAVLTGGTSGYLYQPALLLRDEIKRRDEARRAFGKEVVFFDYDAVTSQVAFVLPKGYTTKAVYSAGTLKRLGSTKDYTVSTDGYAETVTFGAAPGNTVWVSIMATRSC